MRLKPKKSFLFFLFLLLFFSSCGGVGSQAGFLPGAGSGSLGGGPLSAAQPLPSELPSPDADPTCHEPDRPCDKIFLFNEEARTVTAMGRGQRNIELKGQILHQEGDSSEPCCQDRFILVKDTENSLCTVARIEEEGRVMINIVTPSGPIPDLIFMISRRGQSSSEGPQECDEVEDTFSDDGFPRIIYYHIGWDDYGNKP